MTAEEIFKKIFSHQITGLMFHDQMSDYYDFLNLSSYYDRQLEQYESENKEFKELKDFYVNHYEKLIYIGDVEKPTVIPDDWYNFKKPQITGSEKRLAVKNAFAKWIEWEESTLKLYSESYNELLGIGEVSSALEIKRFIKAVTAELKRARNEYNDLNLTDFDVMIIYEEQKHET